MERHRALVQGISSAVRAFYAAREPYRIFHGSTNSTRPATAKGGARAVDISALRDVLAVDRTTRRALVEPNVPMDRLVEATLRQGLVPPVVMEFPGITAGGGFAGTAGESSSFRHGFFDDTVRSVEMVLPDGEVVTAAPDPGHPHAELFRAAAGAVGTLGVTTLLELELVPAPRFVRVTYRRTHSVAEAVAAIRDETRGPQQQGGDGGQNDYVDGILFSKDHGVVITGKMTDEKPDDAPVQTFSRARDPWFYLHVQERTKHIKPKQEQQQQQKEEEEEAVVDYVPLAEYLFRYDRAGFWVARSGWRYFGGVVPFNRLTRWFLDDFVHTRMLYRALHGSGESARFVVQDVAMPFATAEALVDWTAAELGIWPLWLCPLRRRAPPTFHPFTTTPPPPSRDGVTANANTDTTNNNNNNTTNDTVPKETTTTTATKQEQEEDPMMLNVGIWGWGPSSLPAFVSANRRLEATVHRLGGMKWLYAHTYYDEDEFWRLYGNKGWYDALRARYRADVAGLPTVYDKVKVDLAKLRAEKRSRGRKGVGGWGSRLKGVPPFGGLYGIWKAIQSKDYLLHRNAEWKWMER